MGIAHNIIKNTGWLYAKMGITMFISLWITRLILNSLGASDFGIYNVVGGAIAMLGFFNGSLASASTRFMAYAEGQGNEDQKTVIFNICMVLHLAIGAFMVLVLILLSPLFFGGVLNIPLERMTAAYVVYGSLVVATFFSVCRVPYDAVLNAHERMKFYAIVGVMESVLKLLIAFACVYTSKDKLIVYAILMAVIPIVVNIVTGMYCKQHFSECKFQPRTYWDKTVMKKMLSFASWVFATTMTSMISAYGIGLVLNHFFGTILNAAHGIAEQLNGQLMTFTNNMQKAAIPVITKSESSGQRTAMLKQSTLVSKYSLMILAVVALPFILEADFILHVWLKDVPQWAVPFTQLTLVLSLTGQLTTSYRTSIQAEGNIALYSKIMSVSYILPIFLIILIFMAGASPVMLYAVRIGWSGIVGTSIILYFMHRNCGLDYRMFTYELLLPSLAITITSLSAGMIPVLLVEESFIRLVLTSCCSFIGILLGFWFLATGENERVMIKGLIQIIRQKLQSAKK